MDLNHRPQDSMSCALNAELPPHKTNKQKAIWCYAVRLPCPTTRRLQRAGNRTQVQDLKDKPISTACIEKIKEAKNDLVIG